MPRPRLSIIDAGAASFATNFPLSIAQPRPRILSTSSWCITCKRNLMSNALKTRSVIQPNLYQVFKNLRVDNWPVMFAKFPSRRLRVNASETPSSSSRLNLSGCQSSTPATSTSRPSAPLSIWRGSCYDASYSSTKTVPSVSLSYSTPLETINPPWNSVSYERTGQISSFWKLNRSIRWPNIWRECASLCPTTNR